MSPLAERWDGTRWTLLSVPAAPAYAKLDGVTCFSARDCWALGSEDVGSRSEVVTDHWNGVAWSAVSAPSVSAYSSLDAVSCPQADSCWAAGSWESASASQYGTLTEHWNGTAWSVATTPTSGESSSQFFGSSCSGASACMTVGSGVTGSLAQRWDGTAWSVSLMAGPETALTGDACTGSRACMAVGYRWTSPQGQVNAAELWNGQTWSALTVPNVDHYPVNNLEGVACTAATDCWAVGGTLNPGAPGAGHNVIAHWNGVKWALAG